MSYNCQWPNFCWLVVWNIFDFPIYWKSSSQLTNSYFSEGWQKTTNQFVSIKALPTVAGWMSQRPIGCLGYLAMIFMNHEKRSTALVNTLFGSVPLWDQIPLSYWETWWKDPREGGDGNRNGLWSCQSESIGKKTSYIFQFLPGWNHNSHFEP